MAHAARRLLRFALRFLLVLALSVEGTSWAVVATMDGMGGAPSTVDVSAGLRDMHERGDHDIGGGADHGRSMPDVGTMPGARPMSDAESMADARSMPCHGRVAEASPARAAGAPVGADRRVVVVSSDHSPVRHPPCCVDDHCHCAGSHAAPSLGANLPLRHGWAVRDRGVARSDHYRSPDLEGLIRPPIV